MSTTIEFTPGHLLVIGAHAADAEIMAGAAVLKHTRAGHRATLVHMTPGEKGHRTLSAEAYAAQKREEAAAAAAALGAEMVMLPYGDGELPVNDQVQWCLADLIRAVRPTLIITHWRGSMHKDHIHTALNVTEALFYAGLPAFRRQHPAHYPPGGLLYAENWEDPYEFEVDAYLDVSDVWEDYLRAIRCYELFRGSISSFRYYDYYDALGTVRGALAGCRKAVAFMLPRGARTRRWQWLPGHEPSATPAASGGTPFLP